MRILFLSHYFPPEGNAPATRVHALCKRWVAAGHEVTVITCAPNVPNGVIYDGYTNAWRQESVIDGIRVIRVWTYLAANRGAVRRIANYLSFMVTGGVAGLFAARPDVVIATSPQFFCGWAGAFVSALRRRPFILEIRDIWPESIRAVGAMRSRLSIRFLEWLERRLYATADHIVTVGAGYRSQLVARGVDPARLSIIMNGVDREQLRDLSEGAATRSRWGLTGQFVCSYIGTVGMACGLQIVLRAAAKLKQENVTNIRFLVVGDGALLEELRAQAKDAQLDNVIFTGRQPKDSIAGFLAASDVCLVHLKRQDLFTSVMPSKIFEALAMGRPIVLGVKGFAAEFIKQSGGGICIEPENEEELLRALKRLAGDPALAAALSRAGQDYVLKDFDRDTLARDYLKVIDSTLRGSSVAVSPSFPTAVS